MTRKKRKEKEFAEDSLNCRTERDAKIKGRSAIGSFIVLKLLMSIRSNIMAPTGQKCFEILSSIFIRSQREGGQNLPGGLATLH